MPSSILLLWLMLLLAIGVVVIGEVIVINACSCGSGGGRIIMMPMRRIRIGRDRKCSTIGTLLWRKIMLAVLLLLLLLLSSSSTPPTSRRRGNMWKPVRHGRVKYYVVHTVSTYIGKVGVRFRHIHGQAESGIAAVNIAVVGSRCEKRSVIFMTRRTSSWRMIWRTAYRQPHGVAIHIHARRRHGGGG